jgi:hypothetical protein
MRLTDFGALLDAGDQVLRSLMLKLEQAINVHLGKPHPRQKSTETVLTTPALSPPAPGRCNSHRFP